MKISIILVLALISLYSVSGAIYQKYYQQAYTVAASMNLQQKIGQTVQVDFYAMVTKNGTTSAEAIKLGLGSLLVSGNGCPDINGNMVALDQIMKQDQLKVVYANATLQNWQKLSDKFNYTINVTANNGKTYRIRPLLATDAVHGDQHVAGNILFPHNIGLSCSHNPNHFYNGGYWVTQSLKKYGFNYAFAPTVAVSHNPQWGRYYETMGQQHDKIFEYAKAYTQGLQGKPGAFTGVLGSVKHFFGDGATYYGADEGNAQVGSFKSFVNHNIQGYNSSVASGIGSVMASYSAINFIPMHAGPYLGTILRGDLSFDGFVISDYMELDKMAEQYLPTSLELMKKNESTVTMFAAGVDMFMIPDRAAMLEYFKNVQMGIQNNTLTMDRLNDAVARILSVKMALGLVQGVAGQTLAKQQDRLHGTSEYQDSLDAVHESLVLLKNSNVIPVDASKLQYIVLVGQKVININNLAKHELFLNYDNIGMQSGGWSARWQGFEGNPIWSGQNKKNSNASSIVDGLKNLGQKFNLVYPNYTTFTDTTKIDEERRKYLEDLKSLRKNMTAKNTLILSVVGQSPYAQMIGDINVPYCQNQSIFGSDGCLWFGNAYSPAIQSKTLQVNFNQFEKNVITHIRDQDKNIPMVTVLLSGRPMIVNSILDQSSAFISAFLPGTSGGDGIVDAITGKYVFRKNGSGDKTNSLSFDWPKSMQQLKGFPYYGADGQIPTIPDPLFKVGYGLSSVTQSQ